MPKQKQVSTAWLGSKEILPRLDAKTVPSFYLLGGKMNATLYYLILKGLMCLLWAEEESSRPSVASITYLNASKEVHLAWKHPFLFW